MIECDEKNEPRKIKKQNVKKFLSGNLLLVRSDNS